MDNQIHDLIRKFSKDIQETRRFLNELEKDFEQLLEREYELIRKRKEGLTNTKGEGL